MKILALTSSFRKNGNTARMVAMILDHMQTLAAEANQPLEVEIIHLAHMQLELCRGCRACFNLGEAKCPHKDDLARIVSKMQAADGLLLASPVYVEDVNGVMKNWIDRLAFECHRPGFPGKYAYLIATSGSGATNHTLQTMATALSTWGFHLVGQDKFVTDARMTDEELQTHHAQRARQAAERFITSMRRKDALRPSFRSLITFSIQQRVWQQNADDSVDYQYWRDQGWLDPQREFYIDHQAGKGKVLLASWLGRIIMRFVVT